MKAIVSNTVKIGKVCEQACIALHADLMCVPKFACVPKNIQSGATMLLEKES